MDSSSSSTAATTAAATTAAATTAAATTAAATDIDINIDMRLNLGNGKDFFSSILMNAAEYSEVINYIKENLKFLFDNDIKSMLDEYKYNNNLFKAKLIDSLSKSNNVTCTLLYKLLQDNTADAKENDFIKKLLTNALYDLVHDHHSPGRVANTHFVTCFEHTGSTPFPINNFNSNQDAIALSVEAHVDKAGAGAAPPLNKVYTDKRRKDHHCIEGILPPLFDVFDTGVVGCARKFMEQVRTLKVFASICDPQGQGPDVGEHPDFDILFEMVLYNMSLLLTTSLFRTFNTKGIFLCASLPKKKSEPGKKEKIG